MAAPCAPLLFGWWDDKPTPCLCNELTPLRCQCAEIAAHHAPTSTEDTV